MIKALKVAALLALLPFILFPLPALALEKVTLQLKWSHAFQFAGYYAAKEKGYYRDVGIDVEIHEATPGTNVPDDVIRGKAQFGIGTSSLLLERNAGKPVVALAVIFQHSPLVLVAAKTNPTQTIHDLVNKRMMMEPQAEEILAYLKQEGVTIEQLQLLKHSFKPEDLLQGTVDVMTAYSTNERFFLDQAKFAYHTYTPRSAGIDFYGDNLFTSEQEIKKHPERAKAFRAASLKGWQYAMTHPDEIIKLILNKYPTSYTRDFLRFEAKEMLPLLQPLLVEMGYMNQGRWRHIANTYANLGMMPADFPLDGFLYNPNPQHDLSWVYRALGVALLAILSIGSLALYIYRTKRKLDLALAESKQAEELIWKQANLDPLTNLPNRRMFRNRLSQEMKKADRSGKKLALMFLDLDHFKEVNDIHGHDKGDLLLVDAARRLQQCVCDSDKLARLGGDEFTIIMEQVDGPHSIEHVANTVLAKLAEPYQLELEAAYISASIGITIYPTDAHDLDSLLKNADQAMYAAKEHGRNRFHYFTESMHQKTLNRIQLVNDLRGALEENQFHLAYQPIVELDSGKICKAEALIRWQHPKRGLVSPQDFIHVTEDTGNIIEIGDWVFREAAQALNRWRDEFGIDLRMSINTSPIQYQDSSDTMAQWFSFLKSLDLPGSAIIVEITESMLMSSHAEITEKLLAFRDRGIQVALDDFGTGYSSLSYLKKFDIDYIKIDRSFVSNLKAGSNDLILCQAIIIMAHKLGLRVIAEGVETEEQRQLLVTAKCDFGQGYLFSRPVSGEVFSSLLENQRLTV